MEVKISGVVICFNEERNIERCIRSLESVVDEIVVLDSFSSDGTEAICQKLGVRFEQHAFDGHIQQKNRAMSLAIHSIVLSLDADESLNEELQASIIEIKKNWQPNHAYKFNRKTNYAGQWINHCGWYPDTKIRIWDTSQGKWGGYNPHDKVELSESVEVIHLKGYMAHYSFYSIAEHKAKVIRYSTIKAKAVYERGRKSNILKILFAPVFKFFWSYVVRLGFLDGYFGLVICGLSAKESYLTYKNISKLQRGKMS